MCVVALTCLFDRPVLPLPTTERPAFPLCRFYGHSLTRSFQLTRQIPLTSPPASVSPSSSFLFTSFLPFPTLFYFLLISTSSLFPLPSPITHWTVYSSILIYLFVSGPSSRPLTLNLYSVRLWLDIASSPVPSHPPSSHQPRFPVLQHLRSPRPRNDQTATRLFNVVKPHSHPVRALRPADTAVVFFVTFNILTRINARGRFVLHTHRHGSHGSFCGLDLPGQEDFCSREEIQVSILQSCFQSQ